MNTFRLIPVAVLLLSSALTAANVWAADPSKCERSLGISLRDRVSDESLRELVDYVTGEKSIASGLRLKERESESSREAFRWSLLRHLESMGYRPEFEAFKGGANVVVEIPGTEHPGEILEVGAHFDSIGPGADDNAAGVAILIHLADLFKDTPPLKTVRLVFHDLEEVDGAGALHHASQIKQDPRRLIGVLLVDAVGYYPAGYNQEVLSIETGNKTGNFPLAQMIEKWGAGHGVGLSFESNRTPEVRADHGAYWKLGLPAILLSRPYGDTFNHPRNHTRYDTANNMNWPYYLRAARAIAAIVDGAVNQSTFDLKGEWAQPASIMGEVQKFESPPTISTLRIGTSIRFQDPEVDRHEGYIEGLKAAMETAKVPKPTESKNRGPAPITITPIETKNQGGLTFPSYQLQSDYRTADPFIRSVLEAHEKEFPGAIRHRHINFYTELARLSRVQKGLMKTFSQSPKFMNAWNTREPMTDFTITVNEATNSGPVKTLDAWSWDRLRSRWAHSLGYLLHSGHRSPEMVAILKKNVEDVYRDRNRYLFAASDSDFMRALSLYILSAKLLENIENASAHQLELNVEGLNSGALDYMKDEKAFAPLIEGLQIENAAEWVRKTFDWINETIYTSGKAISLSQGDQLLVREVPPELAIFRGYVGNDCSTSFSPGFPFTPADRYYYVFDKDGRSLGYVGISLVSIDNQKAVFVHTIQGPDLTAAHTEMILRAFAEIAKPVFEAESAVLGPDRSIHANVNFFPISEAMMAAVAKQVPNKVTWWDVEYRQMIVNFDSMIEYDNPDHNPTGRKLEYSNPNAVRVDLTRRPFENKFKSP